MPSHANCVVPGCPNRKDKCKWGLFSSEHDVQGRKVYVKRRLCGSRLDKVGCRNTSSLCKAVSFHRLPKDAGTRGVLRRKWLAHIPRENTPVSANSYICGVHFPAGHPDDECDTPVKFVGKPVIVKRSSRASTKAPFYQAISTSEIDLEVDDLGARAEDPSICSATILTKSIEDPHKKQIQDQRKTIEDLEKRVVGLETLLAESRAEVDSLKFSVHKLRAAPASFAFYTGLTVEAFDDILQLVGSAALSLTYGGVVDPEQPKKRAGNRSLSIDAELLLTLMKRRHNFPELDLAQRLSISQSTVSQFFFYLGALFIPYF